MAEATMTTIEPGTSSAILRGWVRHRRYAPLAHAFRYRLCMLLLDLDELPRLFGGSGPLWSTRWPAPLWFRRRDYLGPAARPLAEAVRDQVEARLGFRPIGPIRLLTHVRQLGCLFNPVSFYFCWRPDGAGLEAIVAEITNTPWGERWAYVLDCRGRDVRRPLRFELAKRFHVSPFFGLDQRYRWTIVLGAHRRLLVHMVNLEGETAVFDATLVLRGEELRRTALVRALVARPWSGLGVIAAIYWQAWRLWRKRAPFHPHPGQTPPHRPEVPATRIRSTT